MIVAYAVFIGEAQQAPWRTSTLEAIADMAAVEADWCDPQTGELVSDDYWLAIVRDVFTPEQLAAHRSQAVAA